MKLPWIWNLIDQVLVSALKLVFGMSVNLSEPYLSFLMGNMEANNTFLKSY